jgi:hypothetical protein
MAASMLGIDLANIKLNSMPGIYMMQAANMEIAKRKSSLLAFIFEDEYVATKNTT